MKYTAVVAAALVAGASATNYTTEVLTAYTTYCPGPTTVAHNGQTYTVTEATTLTITNCPCTVTKPIYSTTVPCSTPVAPYPTGNGTAPHPVGPTAPASGTAAPKPSPASPSSPNSSQGAAVTFTSSGAALAGVAALAAFLF